jgi:hypothetical protein
MRPSYSVKNLKTQNSAKAPVRFENAGLKMHHSADTGTDWYRRQKFIQPFN